MHLWALLAATVVVNLFLSFHPFQLDPPGPRSNAIVRRADGSLDFQGPSIARTSGPPSFLADAIRTSALDVELDLRSAEADQWGPARILTISRDHWQSNLTIGQQGVDLVVRLRRPGSTSWGGPIFDVPGAFAEPRWRHLRISIDETRIEIRLGDRLEAEAALPRGSLKTWDPGHRLALGDEVIGGRPWRGEIRRARVQVAGRVVDLLEAPEIETPERYWYWPKRLRRPQQWHREEFVPAVWHLVSLIPFGFAVARLWRGRRPLLAAGGASLGVSLVLLGGKIFLSGRHPYVYDVIAQTCGGLLGGWLALGRFGRRRGSSEGLG
jgi:VanZ family protein